MKCGRCKSSDIQLKSVEEEIRSGRVLFLVPMDVLVCSSCSKRYYDRKTMRKIEETRSKIKEKGLDAREVGRVLRVQAA